VAFSTGLVSSAGTVGTSFTTASLVKGLLSSTVGAIGSTGTAIGSTGVAIEAVSKTSRTSSSASGAASATGALSLLKVTTSIGCITLAPCNVLATSLMLPVLTSLILTIVSFLSTLFLSFFLLDKNPININIIIRPTPIT
jgi:hypothetical protein